MLETTVDVVVVGAGLSGLQAAVEVQKSGLSCWVLEATDRVGGKTLSIEASPQGGVVDLGAAWINDTSQSHMFELARQFGFDLKVQRTTGLSLSQSEDGSVVSVEYGDLPLSDEDKSKVQEFLAVLESYVEQSNLQNPELGPQAKELDSITLMEFAQKNFDTPHAQVIAGKLAQAWVGAEADEMSALYLVDYIKSGTGLENMSSDLKNGGQYLRNRQGNQTFSKRLAQLLRPDSVYLGSPVREISQTEKRRCQVKTSTGITVHCQKVILSIPTTLYSSINFLPSLPSTKQMLGDSTALGYYAKMIFVFEKPWWREAGLSGVFNSDIGPLSFSRDTCVEEDKQFSITCFLVGDTGRRWSKFSKTERRRQAENQFQNVFGSVVDTVPEPINIIEKEWMKDPWARGAPSPIMLPGVMTSDAGKSIRDSFGDIHFIGTETAFVWKGYMEGAVRSGIRGAAEVTQELCKPDYLL